MIIELNWRIIMKTTLFCVFLLAFNGASGQDQKECLPEDAAGIYHHFQFDYRDMTEQFTPEEEENWKDVSEDLLPSLDRILAAMEDKMEEISRAAQIESCQWKFPFKEEGYMTDVTALTSLRFMSQCFLAKARQSFASGNHEAAISNILSVFRLARHVGKAETILAKITQWKMEEAGLFLLFLHRDDFSPEQKKILRDGLLPIHSAESAATILSLEEKQFYPWVRGNFILPHLEPEYPMFQKFSEAIQNHPNFSLNDRESLCQHFQNYFRALSASLSCSEEDLPKFMAQLKEVMIHNFMYPYTSEDVTYIRKCERENRAYWKMVFSVL